MRTKRSQLPNPGANGAAPLPALSIHDQLFWSLANISTLTTLSRRLLERELSAGRMPPPDQRKGRRCLWRPSTIRRWLGEEEP
jgi:hypothetical protein